MCVCVGVCLAFEQREGRRRLAYYGTTTTIWMTVLVMEEEVDSFCQSRF